MHLPRCGFSCVRVDSVIVGTQFGSPGVDKGCWASKSSVRSRGACTVMRPGSPGRVHPVFYKPIRGRLRPVPSGPASNTLRLGRHCCPSSVNTSLPAPSSLGLHHSQPTGGNRSLSHLKNPQSKLSSPFLFEYEENVLY